MTASFIRALDQLLLHCFFNVFPSRKQIINSEEINVAPMSEFLENPSRD